jgi:hypothetical protein
MSVIKEIYPICDRCDETYPDVRYGTIGECKEGMRCGGWKIIKGNDVCPDCVRAINRAKKETT